MPGVFLTASHSVPEPFSKLSHTNKRGVHTFGIFSGRFSPPAFGSTAGDPRRYLRHWEKSAIRAKRNTFQCGSKRGLTSTLREEPNVFATSSWLSNLRLAPWVGFEPSLSVSSPMLRLDTRKHVVLSETGMKSPRPTEHSIRHPTYRRIAPSEPGNLVPGQACGLFLAVQAPAATGWSLSILCQMSQGRPVRGRFWETIPTVVPITSPETIISTRRFC